MLSILRAAAVTLGFFLEFILPIPVCLRARDNVVLLSLIPNIVADGFFCLFVCLRKVTTFLVLGRLALRMERCSYALGFRSGSQPDRVRNIHFGEEGRA